MSTSFSLKPSMNWLLAFIPISLALESAHAPDPVLFFSAALAIVSSPLRSRGVDE